MGWVMTKICVLVKDGASVNRAQGLHIAAGNWKIPSLFHLLTALGGDVNAADFSGNRPLHVAAVGGIIDAARVLLELGADKTVQNKAGKRPKDEVDSQAQSMDDFGRAMGMHRNPMFAAKRAQEDVDR